MAKINEMLSRYKTKKTAKKHGRSFEQQEYRDNLAKSLKGLRSSGDVGKEQAQVLLDEKKSSFEYLRHALGGDKKVGKEFAYEMIANGQLKDLAGNLEKFEGLDNKVAETLIEAGYGHYVADYIDVFKGVNYKEIAEKLIVAGEYKALARNFEKFKGLNREEFAKKMYDAGARNVVIDYFYEFFKKFKQEKKIEKLKGNKDAILEDLKKNYVLTINNRELEGFKGKAVSIELPAIGKFKGYEFKCFISYGETSKRYFDGHPELYGCSYSMREIGELLEAMREYMGECGVSLDIGMNFEKDLAVWGVDCDSDAGNCLKQVLGLNDSYWLRDEGVNRFVKNSRAKWCCYSDVCRFGRIGDDNYFGFGGCCLLIEMR